MLNLFINETKKNNILTIFIIATIIFVGINFLLSFSIESYTMSNWKEKAQEERKIAEQFIESNKANPESDSEEIINSWEETIHEIDYCIDNDIPYGVMTVWEYLINIEGMSTFVFLVVIVFVARIFNIEDEYRTWKNLFTTSVSRKRILTSKVLFGCVLTVLLSLYFTIISFLFGAVANGNVSSLTLNIWENNHYIHKNIFAATVIVYALFILRALLYASLTLMISSMCKKNVISYLVPIIILFIGELIYDNFDHYTICKYLPFRYLFTSGSDYLTGGLNTGFSIVILMLYTVVFMVSSILMFRRKNY